MESNSTLNCVSRSQIEVDFKFGTIFASPPWEYKKTTSNKIQGKVSEEYATMTLDEMCDIPVQKWSRSETWLYMWTSNPFIKAAISLGEAWGFNYVTKCTWEKTSPKTGLPITNGIGHHFATNNEDVLFFRRSNKGTIKEGWKRPPSVIQSPTLGHSQHPKIFFDLAVQHSEGPYLDLFGDDPREDWVVWGHGMGVHLSKNGATPYIGLWPEVNKAKRLWTLESSVSLLPPEAPTLDDKLVP